MPIGRKRVDKSIENKIATAFIVSSKFCKEVIPVTKSEYFESDYIKKIVNWVVDYHTKYDKAPNKYIQEIYNLHKDNLKEAEVENIGILLSKLSDFYEDQDSFNSDYYSDIAIEYYRKQAIKIMSEKTSVLIEMNELDEAEKVIQNYHNVAKETSRCINPMDPDYIRKVMLNNTEDNVLFSFPGALGEVIGNLERGWLVGILGPMKRGKTWYLQEFAIYALYKRLKVLFISLEMDSDKVSKRIYKRLTALGEEAKDYVYPIFDCKRNQDGTCSKKERVNKIKLLSENGEKPEFDLKMKYRPCSVCRDNGLNGFLPESWFTVYKRDKLKVSSIINMTKKGSSNSFRKNLRVLSYPAYSANIEQIKFDLSLLEQRENFLPDVLVIDYADILAPEDRLQVGRERLDDTWKMLKNLSQVHHCLVVTASQSNRASINKKNVTQIDIAEDIRKVAHVDMMISLSQLPYEKRSGIMRIAVVAHRERDFQELKQCMVLQQLELGQPHLDSEFYYDNDGLAMLREKFEEGQ